jgi:hypothetical protein
VQTIALLREDREALQCLVEELEAQVKPLTPPKTIERLSTPLARATQFHSCRPLLRHYGCI